MAICNVCHPLIKYLCIEEEFTGESFVLVKEDTWKSLGIKVGGQIILNERVEEAREKVYRKRLYYDSRPGAWPTTAHAVYITQSLAAA